METSETPKHSKNTLNLLCSSPSLHKFKNIPSSSSHSSTPSPFSAPFGGGFSGKMIMPQLQAVFSPPQIAQLTSFLQHIPTQSLFINDTSTSIEPAPQMRNGDGYQQAFANLIQHQLQQILRSSNNGSYDFAQNPSSAEAIFDGTLPPIQQCENDNGVLEVDKQGNISCPVCDEAVAPLNSNEWNKHLKLEQDNFLKSLNRLKERVITKKWTGFSNQQRPNGNKKRQILAKVLNNINERKKLVAIRSLPSSLQHLETSSSDYSVTSRTIPHENSLAENSFPMPFEETSPSASNLRSQTSAIITPPLSAADSTIRSPTRKRSLNEELNILKMPKDEESNGHEIEASRSRLLCVDCSNYYEYLIISNEMEGSKCERCFRNYRGRSSSESCQVDEKNFYLNNEMPNGDTNDNYSCANSLPYSTDNLVLNSSRSDIQWPHNNGVTLASCSSATAPTHNQSFGLDRFIEKNEVNGELNYPLTKKLSTIFQQSDCSQTPTNENVPKLATI